MCDDNAMVRNTECLTFFWIKLYEWGKYAFVMWLAYDTRLSSSDAISCHIIANVRKRPWLDQTILKSLDPFCQHTLINSKSMYVLETCYRTQIFGLLSLIHFKSSTMIYSFIYRTLTCLIHIGNDVPFLVLPISCWERVHHSSVLVTHVLLNVFTPCWGICVTNRNRTIL